MTKRKSIVILSIFAVLVILAIVFSCVSIEGGGLGRYDYIAYAKAISMGLDLKGGVYAVFEAEKPEDQSDSEFKQSLEGTALSLESLLFSKGFTEAIVSTSNNRITVEVPDVEDSDTVFDLIGRPATLEFKESEDSEVLVSGKNLSNAYVARNENQQIVIAIEFDAQGTEDFAAATEKLNGKTMGIYVNGELLMEPTVNSVISNGKATIEGNYTYDQAYDLSVQLLAGSFDLDLELIESKLVNATLGSTAIRGSLIAGLVGVILIFIFMAVIYRMLGLAANLALVYYIVTFLFFLSVFPWVQLTLPGIAGIILSIGMAIDANVIISERIKDEYKTGKSIKYAVSVGFKKSYSAIIDSNITTILSSIVLWWLGPSTVKGFAITLLIGIILSLFTSLVVTRIILECFLAINDRNPKLYNLKRGKAENERRESSDDEKQTNPVA